jgi:hypothetical protein
LAAGESIVRVPPKLMAHVRDSARTYGKSDPIDALSGYDLTCRSGYDLTCRSRQGDHVMGSPPATRVRRSLRR